MAYTTIDDPSVYFQIKTYTGNGSTLSLTNTGNSDLQPDLVWIKNRTTGYQHQAYDSVRGVQKKLLPSTVHSESDSSAHLTAFNSDGFTLGSNVGINQNTSEHVAWQWKEHATAGFDIVSYTGTGSARTISHSLGVKPAMMICKMRSGSNTGHWALYHRDVAADPATDYLYLDEGDALADDATFWNDTEPTTSVFSVGTNDHTNKNTETFIAYLWAEIQGYSRFGSYVGNGQTQEGPFAYTGFKPAFVMIKNTETASRNWYIYDIKRRAFNSNG